MKKHSPYKIVKTVLITEKATDFMDSENKYFFSVDKRANKIEIKKSIETLFGVAISSVNTMNYDGKVKRVRGKKSGKRAGWKKAVVQLKEGSTIELY